TTIIYVAHYRNWVTKMNGMMISMSLGMSAGILMGTILGVIYHGDLFKSTIYAIIIGLIVWFLAGLPIGLPGVIDGMVTALLGWMMVAMLGDMVIIHRTNLINNIIAVYIAMVLVLVLYAADEYIHNQARQQIVYFFNYPFLKIFT